MDWFNRPKESGRTFVSETIGKNKQFSSFYRKMRNSEINLLKSEDFSYEESVVGMRFRLESMAAVQHLVAGDLLFLRREPDNPHDKNAIRVEAESGIHIGYLPGIRAEILAPLLDNIKEPVAVRITWMGGNLSSDPNIKVRFTLPAVNKIKVIDADLP
jgi:hypothetical protein